MSLNGLSLHSEDGTLVETCLEAVVGLDRLRLAFTALHDGDRSSAGRYDAASWLAGDYGNQRAGGFVLYSNECLLSFDSEVADLVATYLRRQLGVEAVAALGPRSRLSDLAG